MLVLADRLPWAALVVIVARDVVPDRRNEVRRCRAATSSRSASRQGGDLGPLRGHRASCSSPCRARAGRCGSSGSAWAWPSPPRVLYVSSAWGASGRKRRHEGGRHGRRRGHAAPPADLEPAEADGADRRQAVHGAHPRAARAPRLRRRDRHARVHAAGDPQLLRRRRVARPLDRVLGRGVAARHGRLGAARLAASSTTPSSSSPATRSATSTSARCSSSTARSRRR